MLVFIAGCIQINVTSPETQGDSDVEPPDTDSETGDSEEKPSQDPALIEERLATIPISLGTLPPKGSESSNAILVEFSDFQCPFCARQFRETYPLLEQNYISRGKLRIYFRDYPLSFHQNALPTALAARCADEQNKFWEYHDLLFERQSQWSNLQNPGETLKGYAEELDLDMEQFNSCYDSRKYVQQVNEDFSEGSRVGVRGTPANYILIKKDSVDLVKLNSVVESIGVQNQGVALFKTDEYYVVSLPGAYPYTFFDQILSLVN